MKTINTFDKLKKSLQGPVQTIFVPFNRKLNIDYPALRKHISILCSFDFVKCLYLMPYKGRYSQLSENEIMELNRFCISEVKKKEKLIIVSDPIHASTETKLKFCLDAKKMEQIFFHLFVEKNIFQISKFFYIIKKFLHQICPS